jgi:hypothetical protein
MARNEADDNLLDWQKSQRRDFFRSGPMLLFGVGCVAQSMAIPG